MAYQSLGSFELACQAFDQAAQALNEESVQLSTKQKAKINQECIHLKNSNRKRVIAMSFTNLVDGKASLGKPGTDDLIPNKHPNIEGFSGNSFSSQSVYCNCMKLYLDLQLLVVNTILPVISSQF